MEHRRLNTYLFVLTVPRVPPEEMEAQGKRAGERLKAGIAEFAERWNSEWLPEVKEHLAFWEGFDLGGASMPELLAHLDDTEARFTRLLEIHFLIAYPFLVAPSMFDELYEDLFGKEGAFDALKLLQGFGNKTVEGGHALWELSRKALASPIVGRVLKEHEAADVTAALARSTEGQAFLAELEAYLEEYGQRSDVFFKVGYPHWVEDPTTPVRNLKEFIAQPDRDLSTELTALAEERERLIAAARERLKGLKLRAIGRPEESAQLRTAFLSAISVIRARNVTGALIGVRAPVGDLKRTRRVPDGWLRADLPSLPPCRRPRWRCRCSDSR